MGVDDPSILVHLRQRAMGDEQNAVSPLWSRTAYDRYLEWAIEAGTTDNGVFGAKLMWGYFGDFVTLLRNVEEYRDVPLADLLPTAFANLTFVRVVRANKLRQAVSLWKAVQTATWREEESRELGADPPYQSFLKAQKPQLRFHYRAISHLLSVILEEEAAWDAFFEHCGVRPILVLHENFAADYETSTRNLLGRLELPVPDDLGPAPLKQQSDGINDDWTRRYSELHLGTQFDLVPARALSA